MGIKPPRSAIVLFCVPSLKNTRSITGLQTQRQCVRFVGGVLIIIDFYCIK